MSWAFRSPSPRRCSMSCGAGPSSRATSTSTAGAWATCSSGATTAPCTGATSSTRTRSVACTAARSRVRAPRPPTTRSKPGGGNGLHSERKARAARARVGKAAAEQPHHVDRAEHAKPRACARFQRIQVGRVHVREHAFVSDRSIMPQGARHAGGIEPPAAVMLVREALVEVDVARRKVNRQLGRDPRRVGGIPAIRPERAFMREAIALVALGQGTTDELLGESGLRIARKLLERGRGQEARRVRGADLQEGRIYLVDVMSAQHLKPFAAQALKAGGVERFAEAVATYCPECPFA